MSERSLRMWFFASIITAVAIVAVPIELFDRPAEHLPIRIAIGVVLTVVIGGFYLWTLYEVRSISDLA